ncbi:MAG: hypothetical protein H6974_00640 [Gammaproteobacteria bacterium]|nr:hypothetical protein [Gammaproteobacteria bacterium]MCP5195302.1 hypothetical protein [Gammaproteobacteria bacterium]
MRNLMTLWVLIALLTGCQDFFPWRKDPPSRATSRAYTDAISTPADPPGRHVRRAERQARIQAQWANTEDALVFQDSFDDRYARRAERQARIQAQWANTEDAPVFQDSFDDRYARRAERRAYADTYLYSGESLSAVDPEKNDNNELARLKTIVLQHQGMERSYLLYVPSNYRSGQPTPLVFVFHGGGGNALGIAKTTNMHQLAEQHGFIVVYPNGTGLNGHRRLTWNAGSSPPQGYAENHNVDDIGFVSKILQQLKGAYSIDSKRVYATGLSKGAMFAYRLGCEMSEQFAAIAPVAGSLTYQQCHPSQPVAVLHIHGDRDQNVPLQGGRAAASARNANHRSPLDGLNQWGRQNRCAATLTKTTVTNDTDRFSYNGCNRSGEVTYYIVRGGGHGWPGSIAKPRQLQRQVYISHQLHASDEIWKFFTAHPRS